MKIEIKKLLLIEIDMGDRSRFTPPFDDDRELCDLIRLRVKYQLPHITAGQIPAVNVLVVLHPEMMDAPAQ